FARRGEAAPGRLALVSRQRKQVDDSHRSRGNRVRDVAPAPPLMPKRAPRAGVRRALNQKQLVLFYQPIHETESRKIVSAEALLRSRRPGGEIRSGVPLTVTAEEGPDLFRLDSWTMKRALRDAATW